MPFLRKIRLFKNTPASVRANPGYLRDRDATDQWAEDPRNPQPYFSDVGQHLLDRTTFDRHKPPVFTTDALFQLFPEFRRGAQQIGSCVGWATAGSATVNTASEIVNQGEPEWFPGRDLEAFYYGASRVEVQGVRRAGWGDGSYCAASAQVLLKHGTMHYGIDYNGTRITNYSGRREKQWGNTGIPDELEPQVAPYKFETVSQVRTAAEAFALCENGLSTFFGSGHNIRFVRDADGFCRLSRGSLPHAQFVVACRYDEPGLGIWNSWGDFLMDDNFGPYKLHPALRYSFYWLRLDDWDRMLQSGEAFCPSGHLGYPAREPDWNKVYRSI